MNQQATPKLEPDFMPWTVTQYLETTFPDLIYLIDGIITEGLVVLAGTPKIGKSWLALFIAFVLSIGGIFFNVRVPEVRTLYIALEDTRRRIKNRLKKINAVASEKCHIVNSWPAGAEGFLWLHKWMEKYPDTKCMIIDTLSMFVQIKDHNSYSEVTPVLKALKQFADQYHVALIVVHHAKKGEVSDFIHSALGSVGIVGTADTILILSRKRGQRDALLQITGRDIEERELAVRLDNSTCKWELIGNAAEVASTKERQEIIDVLKAAKGEPMKIKEIANILNKKYDNVKYLLLKLDDEGKIQKVDKGTYLLNSTSNASLTSLTSNASGTTEDGQIYVDFG